LVHVLQLNDRLSLGQHRVWKRMAVKWCGAAPGQRALDVCCGSGDLALLLAAAVGKGGSVTGLDFAADMLQVRRCELARFCEAICCGEVICCGDAAADVPAAAMLCTGCVVLGG
jgi:tRNA A58 N-methylase Trm61